MQRAAKLTPMLRHYLEVKSEHPDAILFYRMGDFYEMFFEDAERAAPILEIALTARQKGSPSEAPMCGVPHHALDTYLGKMVRAGIKVAICDQVEDPAEAKGLVRREVTRVVTPGTVSEPALLEGKEDNLLCALSWSKDAGAGAFLDVSTGKLVIHRWHSAEEAVESLSVLRPSELIFGAGELPGDVTGWLERQDVCRSPIPAEDAMTAGAATRLLEEQFETATLRGFGMRADEPAALATATALRYARETQKSELTHVDDLELHEERAFMALDETTLFNLEVVRSQREGARRGTLLGVVDRTCTAMGGRRLRSWFLEPLLDRAAIRRRHDAVEELLDETLLRQRLREDLGRVADMERLLTRAVLGTASPREVGALRDSLAVVAEALPHLKEARTEALGQMAGCDVVEDLRTALESRLAPELPTSLAQGGVVAEGVNADLDRCRSLVGDTKQHILELEAQERERSGISSLKVGYNRVFGYYLEVTKANQHRVPDDYVRKQTLTNAERYITPEIKELEEQILGAEESRARLEEQEFGVLVAEVVAASRRIRRLAIGVGELDSLASLAEVAARNHFCRPRMEEAGRPIRIRDGRHPVVESMLREEFVPNDCQLDDEESQIVVLTGPNMGGKSTYLRQVALIVLMAQAGSFVPARECRIGLVDRIFTRVGASDDLTRGESTFMVEMIETANILRYASERSLVVLDEVGRGTATFDGLSLAWAIVEHLHEHCRPKTLFATHYHELTELATILPRVTNRTMAVREWEERIVFLRRVVAGSADKSYGIQVARLAGLPPSVLDRAAEILANLERHEYDLTGKPRLAKGAATDSDPGQLALFTPPEELVAGILREVDLEQLSPLAALNLLHTLKSRLDPSE
ncbi:MAG: DNA mismatch repair protein MutS [Acidobacteriota bacterium]|nr:DNA mismatch repair protein MutS [Acidobacteriota bacterium]